MKGFVIPLLGVILVLLLTYSVESVIADHLEPGDGIFTEYGTVNLDTTKDSKWQVNLQLVIRTGDGQLINVTEGTDNAAYISHKITDHVFDNLMGEKEIVTIDDIKYEKVQYTFTPTFEQRFMGLYPIYTEIILEVTFEGDALTKMQIDRDYSLWKIHHCATFRGHDYDCIPVFQVLVPTMTLEPDDVVTQHWTILRELN